jgi:SpoVK/Ycf46/Vps4 family AAA+-type ATPase
MFPPSSAPSGFDMNGMMMSMIGMNTMKEVMSTVQSQQSTLSSKCWSLGFLLFMGFLSMVGPLLKRVFTTQAEKWMHLGEHWYASTEKTLNTMLEDTVAATDKAVPDEDKEPTTPILSEVHFTYHHQGIKLPSLAESVNAYICKLDSARVLDYDGTFSVKTEKPFVVDRENQIWCRVQPNKSANKGDIREGGGTESVMSILIYSYTIQLRELKTKLEQWDKLHVFEKNNKLGNALYYFNETTSMATYNRLKSIPANTLAALQGSTGGNKNTNTRFEFSMNEFQTSKTLDNIFGTHLDELKQRLHIYKNTPQWYVKKGIPRRLGILLYGPPGTGKTSLIKAIANTLRLHIFNLSITPYTTETELFHFFHNPTICARDALTTQPQIFNIENTNRLIVFEDIDALTDVFHHRDHKLPVAAPPASSVPASAPTGPAAFSSIQATSGSAVVHDAAPALTLSAFLNLIDGVLESNTIEIYTTNDPSKLDPALIRSGRIDFLICLDFCSVPMIHEMLSKYYEISLEEAKAKFDPVEHLYEKNRTPSDIQNAYLTNIHNIDRCIQTIIHSTRDDPIRTFLQPVTDHKEVPPDVVSDYQEYERATASILTKLKHGDSSLDFVKEWKENTVKEAISAAHGCSNTFTKDWSANTFAPFDIKDEKPLFYPQNAPHTIVLDETRKHPAGSYTEVVQLSHESEQPSDIPKKQNTPPSVDLGKWGYTLPDGGQTPTHIISLPELNAARSLWTTGNNAGPPASRETLVASHKMYPLGKDGGQTPSAITFADFPRCGPIVHPTQTISFSDMKNRPMDFLPEQPSNIIEIIGQHDDSSVNTATVDNEYVYDGSYILSRKACVA